MVDSGESRDSKKLVFEPRLPGLSVKMQNNIARSISEINVCTNTHRKKLFQKKIDFFSIFFCV